MEVNEEELLPLPQRKEEKRRTTSVKSSLKDERKEGIGKVRTPQPLQLSFAAMATSGVATEQGSGMEKISNRDSDSQSTLEREDRGRGRRLRGRRLQESRKKR